MSEDSKKAEEQDNFIRRLILILLLFGANGIVCYYGKNNQLQESKPVGQAIVEKVKVQSEVAPQVTNPETITNIIKTLAPVEPNNDNNYTPLSLPLRFSAYVIYNYPGYVATALIGGVGYYQTINFINNLIGIMRMGDNLVNMQPIVNPINNQQVGNQDINAVIENNRIQSGDTEFIQRYRLGANNRAGNIINPSDISDSRYRQPNLPPQFQGGSGPSIPDHSSEYDLILRGLHLAIIERFERHRIAQPNANAPGGFVYGDLDSLDVVEYLDSVQTNYPQQSQPNYISTYVENAINEIYPLGNFYNNINHQAFLSSIVLEGRRILDTDDEVFEGGIIERFVSAYQIIEEYNLYRNAVANNMIQLRGSALLIFNSMKNLMIEVKELYKRMRRLIYILRLLYQHDSFQLLKAITVQIHKYNKTVPEEYHIPIPISNVFNRNYQLFNSYYTIDILANNYKDIIKLSRERYRVIQNIVDLRQFRQQLITESNLKAKIAKLLKQLDELDKQI